MDIGAQHGDCCTWTRNRYYYLRMIAYVIETSSLILRRKVKLD